MKTYSLIAKGLFTLALLAMAGFAIGAPGRTGWKRGAG